MFATWHLPMQGDVRLIGSVQNMFDEEARQHSSFLKDEVPLPGRNFKLAIAARF